MTSPDKLTARAEELYDQAQAVQDAEQGLIDVLRSMERDEAAVQRGHATESPSIEQRPGNAPGERA